MTALLLAACTAPADDAAPSGMPPGVVVDYQLGGGSPPADGITGVVRDVTDVPAEGLWSVCYVNGFQTQPGALGRWEREHPDLLLRSDDGAPVRDPAWPDEALLDTSTADRRAAVAAVVAGDVQECADRGFDAVELDNLDSWTRSDGRLTADGALDLSRRLVDVAHAAGLVVAQKNAAELGARGRDEAGFDLAVVEECHRWDECGAYAEVYGDAVVAVEYADDLRGTWADVCADPATPSSVVLRDRALAPAGTAGHVLAAC